MPIRTGTVHVQICLGGCNTCARMCACICVYPANIFPLCLLMYKFDVSLDMPRCMYNVLSRVCVHVCTYIVPVFSDLYVDT